LSNWAALLKPQRTPEPQEPSDNQQKDAWQQKRVRELINEMNLDMKFGRITPEYLLESFHNGLIAENHLTKLISVFDDGVFEDEDDEEEIDLSGMSIHECPCCSEQLALTEEVFLLEVMESEQSHGEIITRPLTGADGDYQYEPLFLHYMCWDECLEIIRSEKEFQPPYASADGILFCSVCESTISSGEPYVSATFGELRYSGKAPEGEDEQRFERLQKPMPVCVACMVYVIEDHLDELEDLLDNLPIDDDEEEEDDE
jgi:hypothetical protein